jgi:3',5'-cyclic AMP phosphodiesterase CpdA
MGLPRTGRHLGPLLSWFSLVSAASLALPAAEFPTYNRRPFLQSLTSSSVLIVSQSKELVAATLLYGLDPSLGTVVEEASAVNDHIFQLEGLTPATTYYYRVRHGDLANYPIASFRTLPDPGSEVTVTAIGDSGNLTDEQLILADLLLERKPDILLHVGDMAYPYGAPSYYHRKFFTVYADLLRSTCVYPTLGNHDCMRGPEYWLYAFHLPANNPASDESYYSFDAGDAHFTALNTCTGEVPEEQLAWLDADLAASQRKWKIVFFHHAPYSNGLHGGTVLVRDAVVPLFEKHGVDLVLSGHDHTYERTYPIHQGTIRGGYQDPDYTSPGGIPYVVTGGGGYALYNYEPSPEAHLGAVFLKKHEYLLLRITPDQIEGTAIGLEGEAIDRFTLRKGDRPLLHFIRGDSNEDGIVGLADAVAALNALFIGVPGTCAAANDADGSGDLSISDPITVLLHLFGGGAPLPSPYPDCGSAEGVDDTGCIRPCADPG